MAQARLKWDQLPQRWRDISVFLPRIATIMGSRFPPSEGFDHEAIGRTEYRVRRGFFSGVDVRVWRQGDLVINVSLGSRLGSLLPVIAAILAAIVVVSLVNLAPEFGIKELFPGGFIKRVSYMIFTVGMVLFLVFWGLLAILMRPFVENRVGCDERVILAEITRGLGG